MNNNGMSWSFFGIWNDSLLKGKQRELKPRENMWASELGGSYIDRYLKMTAVTPTNPPNARSLRKFQAGNIWEWIIGHVLKRAGILLDSQGWIDYQYPGLARVTGKLDFMAGGSPDWEKAQAEVKSLELPELLEQASLEIINQLQAKYGNELKKVILEVKSVSSFMFDRYERIGTANANHVMQLFHYLKAKNMPEGHIIYICKDDCRMLEIPVFHTPDGNSPAEQMYKKDITDMSYFVQNKIQPEKEQEILFDTETGKFTKNWKVEYSNYLEMLYGYKEPMAYSDRWKGDISSFNRVLKRVVDGANMTKLNLEVIEKMQAYFPNYEELVQTAKDLKSKGQLAEEEEGGEE